MKYKLLAIVVIALLLCAAVPMMASATPTPKPPRDVRMMLSTDPSHGKTKVANGATVTVPTGTTAFTLTAPQSGYWTVSYPSGLGWVPKDPSTSIAVETTNEPGSYFVKFGPSGTGYAGWSATIVVPPTPAPPPV